MAGTAAGGKLAAETNIKKYGKDYYRRIGAKGGAKGRTGGFAYMKIHDPVAFAKLSAKGGRISRRA